MTERSPLKFLPLALAVALVAFGIVQFLQRRKRKPRSFREDPIGALKDRGGIVASRAQEAADDAVERLQETLDEIRDRLPEFNRRRMQKRRKEVNKRLSTISAQAQDLLKDLRASSVISR